MNKSTENSKLVTFLRYATRRVAHISPQMTALRSLFCGCCEGDRLVHFFRGENFLVLGPNEDIMFEFIFIGIHHFTRPPHCTRLSCYHHEENLGQAATRKGPRVLSRPVRCAESSLLLPILTRKFMHSTSVMTCNSINCMNLLIFLDSTIVMNA